jgi:putative transposase
MARLLRVQFEGAIYHVTARGNERRVIFRDDADRERFLRNLAQAQQLHGVRLYLVCLMPNHFHVLLETPAGNLSAFMAGLLTAYAVYYNRRHRRTGHLTQGRYKAHVVEGNEYLLKLSRYIHLNPVCGKSWKAVALAERVEALRAYRWSTYRSYCGLEGDWAFVDYGPMRALVEQLGVSCQQFVEAGLASDDEEFRALYQQARLSVGSEEFQETVQRAHQRAAATARRTEDVALRRRTGAHSVQETLAAVAEVFGIGESALRQRSRGALARGAAAWALVRHAGLTERATAQVLGMGTGAAVSQQLAKWRRAVMSEPRCQKLQTKLEERLAAANF